MEHEDNYEVCDYGLEHSDYFQGHGCAFTEFTECCYGIGDTYNEALEDALEQAASAGDLPEGLADYIAEHEKVSAEQNETVSASAEISSQLESEFPIKWNVSHTAYCGMVTYDETYDEFEDALEDIRAQIIKYCARLDVDAAEFLAQIPENSAAENVDGTSVEILEPEDCALVPDECGSFMIGSNAEEVKRDRERAEENASLYYHVGIRWNRKAE